jgi:hypothetical protein
MTRAGDVAPPAISVHPIGPGAPIYGWPWWPVIGLEMVDTAAYVWDDADVTVAWDDPNPDRLVWDNPATVSGFYDAVCDLIACEIEPGEADDLYLFPPTQCTLTLDNSTGRYTPWTADGRLTYWAPGRRVCLWARNAAGARWWLFSGRVATWQSNPDGTVTVVAFDGMAQLAQQIAGGQWAPGFAGDTVQARIATVAGAAGYTGRLDLEAGTVTLSTYSSSPVPLEAIQQAALSDGGLFYGDADGSLDYRGRLWRAGRTDTPAPGWTVATNVCEAPVIVWDPEAAADDDRLVTDVALVNVAGLTATAALTGSLWAGDARFRLTHTDHDLWQTQQQGNDLAAYLLAQQSAPAMALASFTLHHLDPSQQTAVPDMGVGVRRGDRVEVLHRFVDQAGVDQLLDVFAIVLGVGHAIVPEEGWTTTVNLSRTVDYVTPELWDRTALVWDDPSPAAVWRY